MQIRGALQPIRLGSFTEPSFSESSKVRIAKMICEGEFFLAS
jgi:hypothetical protein